MAAPPAPSIRGITSPAKKSKKQTSPKTQSRQQQPSKRPVRVRRPNRAVVPVNIPPTPGGAWLLSMLSPAHSNSGHRQPGGSRLPTVATKYRKCITIPAPPGLTEGAVWNMEVYQRADPVLPVVVRTYIPTSVEEVPNYHYYYLGPNTDNPLNLSPVDLVELTNAFRDGKQAYRLNGQSITGIPSIPQIAGNGTVISAQAEMRPLKMSALVLGQKVVGNDRLLWGSSSWYPESKTGSARVPAQPLLNVYSEEPPINNLLTGTLPYQASAKAGFYQPLRITPKHMISTDSWVTVFGSNANADSDLDVQTIGYTMDQLGTGFPYYLTLGEGFAPCHALTPYSYITGMTKVEGLPIGSSFRITLVQDLEFIPQLNDIEWCGSAVPAPVPEPWVMTTYESVVATLQDAYPYAYNDSSILLKKLKAIIRKILPYVSTGVNLAAYATGLPELAAAGRVIDRFDAMLQHADD